MNIDGMGESLVTQLIEKGLVKNVADIYDLNKERPDKPGALCRKIGAEHSRRNR